MDVLCFVGVAGKRGFRCLGGGYKEDGEEEGKKCFSMLILGRLQYHVCGGGWAFEGRRICCVRIQRR